MLTKFNNWLQGHQAFSKFTNRRFFNYFWISAVISLFNILALWLLIDWLDLPTILASSLVIGGTFVGRYLLFQIFPVV